VSACARGCLAAGGRADGMGRKGSKRRHRQQQQRHGATKLARLDAAGSQQPPAPATDGDDASSSDDCGAAGGRSFGTMHGGKVMPWTRWKKGEVQNAKLEHQELAEWKKGSFTNKAFEEYYIRNGVVTEREWPRLLDVLRRPLPTTFRLHASHPSAAGLRARLLRGDFNVPVPQPRDAARRQPFMGAAPARDATVRTVPGLPASAQAWQLGFDRAAFRSHAARVPVIGELFAELRDAVSLTPAAALLRRRARHSPATAPQ
jgi:hypothetical protein